MRRVALFSDIHGNAIALDAVLADMQSCGSTEVYCLGDLVGYGPDPAGVVSRIREAGIPAIKGNYDEGIGDRRGECGCYYATDQARSDGAASYAFTDKALNDVDHAWLASLPDEIRFECDGARILLAHGSPRKINEYLLLDRQERLLIKLAQQADADVVCVGHVHVPYHRSMTTETGERVHYVSSGSVGKPKDGDPRAAWVEVVLGTEAEVQQAAEEDGAVGPAGTTGTWVGAITHRVTYDIEAVATAMIAARLPVTLVAALRQG
jgi:predicted phosphodiesterase